MKFEELNIHGKVLEGIRAAGFTECTPVQEESLPFSLRGKDIAAQAQTGTGKTAAFLITLFSRMHELPSPGRGKSPRALVIAPTRELVSQIEAEAKLIGGPSGFRIVSAFGGMNYIKQRDDIAKGADLLVGTPGRLIDYLKQKVYSLRKTQFLVIDEADRMFDMGFIKDLRFLLRRMSPYDKRQSMLYSATLSGRVMELCYEHMNLPEKISITPGEITVERIDQSLYHTGMSEKMGLMFGILRREPGGRYLIFCNTRVGVDRLVAVLRGNSYTTASITGDLTQSQRMKALERFKTGSLQILVATDVASRGLHIDSVTHVINYDLPQDPEDYVHRIGRTARAGARGKAISLACEHYVHSLPSIEEYLKKKIPVSPVTDELIVTDFKKVRRSMKKDIVHGRKPGRTSSGNGRGQKKPSRKPSASYSRKRSGPPPSRTGR